MRRRVEIAIQTYSGKLFVYGLSLCRNRDLAQDLTQETAVRAITAAAVPPDDRALKAWLFRILHNVWVDGCRRDRLLDPLPDEDNEGSSVAREYPRAAERLLDRLAVKQALQKVAAAHREIILLVDFEGFSYAETAEILNVCPGTVMSRVSRARAALLKILSEAEMAHSGKHPVRPGMKEEEA